MPQLLAVVAGTTAGSLAITKACTGKLPERPDLSVMLMDRVSDLSLFTDYLNGNALTTGPWH